FAAFWPLAGSPSAEEAKVPIDKPEPKISPNNTALKASNDFACDLYRSLDQENRDKNLFFSPYSISSALAMTLEGARGTTAAAWRAGAAERGQAVGRPPPLRHRAGDDKNLP